jgi:hypothetical protein
MINSVKTLIDNKLALIDIENSNNKGIPTITRINHELRGIRQVLGFMGFDLQLDINPYYHVDGKSSTYTISLI